MRRDNFFPDTGSASGRPARQSGFTLIELLIGVALSLLSIMLLAQVLTSMSSSRKNIIGGGDAATSAAIASSFIEREIRQAGHGINFSPWLGCQLAATDSTTGRAWTMPLLPVSIVSSGANVLVSDTIRIQYSASDSGHNPAQAASAPSSTSAEVDNRYGFRANEFFAISSGTTTDGCALYNVVSTGVTGGTGATLNYSGGRWNGSSGKPGFSAGARIMPFGTAFVDRNIAVASNRMTGYDSMNPEDTAAPTAPSVLADGIVAVKAEYLLSTGGTPGAVNTTSVEQGWTAATLTGEANIAANWPAVRGVRYAIIARSKEPDMEWAANPASATLTYFEEQNMGSAVLPQRAITLTSDQRRFKYVVRSEIVPLRNQLWGGN